MFKLFSEKDVRKLVARIKGDYEEALRIQREAAEQLKTENRNLRARLSVLERERGNVSDALVSAVAEGNRIKKSGAEEAENDRKELKLLAEKCRLLSQRLLEKYPDEEDCADFAAFTQALREQLGESQPQQEEPFDLDEVLNPAKPLDLAKLCKDLGVMEED